MSTFTTPFTFIANTKIKSASVNANFAALASVLNTNLLPAIGNTNALVTTSSGGNLQSVLPIGTEGQTLVVDPTATTTGGLKWATPSVGTSQIQLENLGLSASASAGALTINVKQSDGTTTPTTGTGAVKIGFRNTTPTPAGYNQRSLESALSTTLSLNTTFGMLPNQNNNVWVYALDTDGAGTLALASSTIFIDDSKLQNVSIESNTATVTITSECTITSSNHGFSNNDGVTFTTTGALPTGISSGVRYWVTNATTNTFQILVNLEGAKVDTSGSQSGIHTIHVASPRLVSTMAYTQIPIRLLGRLNVNLITPGTWITPYSIDLANIGLQPEAISAKYSGATTLGNGNFANLNMIYDTHGLVDSSGRFLAPLDGLFEIDVSWTANAISGSVGNKTFIIAQKNSVDETYLAGFIYQTTSSIGPEGISGSTMIKVSKGDVITLAVATGVAGQQLDGGSPTNFASFIFTPIFT